MAASHQNMSKKITETGEETENYPDYGRKESQSVT